MPDAEPFPFHPDRIEPRGHFPEHDEHPRPVFTAEQAREYIRRRLEAWEAEHGD